MNNLNITSKALSQVYSVLIRLSNDELKKIPQSIIDGIKNNMDTTYSVDYEEIDSNILPDAEQILATLYTYYLASDKEKELIYKINNLKQNNKYDNASWLNNKNISKLQYNEDANRSLIKTCETNNFILRVFNRVKRILKK